MGEKQRKRKKRKASTLSEEDFPGLALLHSEDLKMIRKS